MTTMTNVWTAEGAQCLSTSCPQPWTTMRNHGRGRNAAPNTSLRFWSNFFFQPNLCFKKVSGAFESHVITSSVIAAEMASSWRHRIKPHGYYL